MTDAFEDVALRHPKPLKRVRARPKPIPSKSPQLSTKLEDVADRLFYRLLLRRASATCEAARYGYEAPDEPLRCRGRLDPAHGWSRAHHSVRWAHANVFCLCRAHHDYFGARPGEWFRWRASKIGPVLMEHVQRLARETWRGDIEDVIAGLRRGVSQLERES